MKNYMLFLMTILAMVGCKTQKLNSSSGVANQYVIKEQFVSYLPHVVIYKTKKDYSHNVPVLLSDDKTKIVSYPHPSDLVLGEKLTLPALLHNEYLLDNKGIGANVAFLEYTYEAYSKLTDVPTLQELEKNIIDKNPLVEIWDCGKKTDFIDLQNQLNEYINKNMLAKQFTRIR